MLAGYTLLPGSDDLHLIAWRAALTYLPLAMIAAVALAAIAAVGLREMRRIARLVVLTPLATALVGPFAVRVILPGGLDSRYFAAGLPGFLLFIVADYHRGADAQRPTCNRRARVDDAPWRCPSCRRSGLPA